MGKLHGATGRMLPALATGNRAQDVSPRVAAAATRGDVIRQQRSLATH